VLANQRASFTVSDLYQICFQCFRTVSDLFQDCFSFQICFRSVSVFQICFRDCFRSVSVSFLFPSVSLLFHFNSTRGLYDSSSDSSARVVLICMLTFLNTMRYAGFTCSNVQRMSEEYSRFLVDSESQRLHTARTADR